MYILYSHPASTIAVTITAMTAVVTVAVALVLGKIRNMERYLTIVTTAIAAMLRKCSNMRIASFAGYLSGSYFPFKKQLFMMATNSYTH